MHQSPPSPPAELLAPAGDLEALKAAVTHGADAVYFGLGSLNARLRASNFTLEDLPDCLDYLHRHQVRGYLTLNTLLFDRELDEALSLAEKAAALGIDALIVQDLGLCALLHRALPDLPLHASTQMTLTAASALNLMKSHGISRAVLPRELTLPEIRLLASQTDLALEVFVHGALCISLSGQCHASRCSQDRSGNRGQCAQPCRLPYRLETPSQPSAGLPPYLLSPPDLLGLEALPALLQAGVSSFKIEGRQKNALYVASVVRTYRQALDAALEGRPTTLQPRQALELELTFSRGFTPGFLGQTPPGQLVEGLSTGKRGVKVGSVVGTSRRGVVIQATHPAGDDLKPGDGLAFSLPDGGVDRGGRLFGVQLEPGRKPAERRWLLTFGPTELSPGEVPLGAQVWKTDDPALRKALEGSIGKDRHFRPLPLHLRLRGEVGGALTLEARLDEGETATATWEGPLEKARDQALSQSLAQDQLGRLGGSPFTLGRLELVGAQDDALPVLAPRSVLNQLRREVVEKLTPLLLSRGRRQVTDTQALSSLREAAKRLAGLEPASQSSVQAPSSRQTRPQGWILVRNQAQLEVLLQPETIDNLLPTGIYLELPPQAPWPQLLDRIRRAGLKTGLATPRALLPGQEKTLDRLIRLGPDVLLLRSLAALGQCLETEAPTDLPALVLDAGFNAVNPLSMAWLLSHPVARLTPGHDLSLEGLLPLLPTLPLSRLEGVIRQRPALYHTRYCLFSARLGSGQALPGCGLPCRRPPLKLTSAQGLKLTAVADSLCFNTFYGDEQEVAASQLAGLAGLGAWRLELLDEPADKLPGLLRRLNGPE